MSRYDRGHPSAHFGQAAQHFPRGGVVQPVSIKMARSSSARMMSIFTPPGAT
ncbi:MAG: hypothetical protein R2849_13325 [Thermomicrobiales bacterium]